MIKEMNREEFLEEFPSISEKDIELIPYHALFYNAGAFDEMRDSLEAEAFLSINKATDIPLFTTLQVDYAGVHKYVQELFDAEFNEDNIGEVDFFWRIK